MRWGWGYFVAGNLSWHARQSAVRPPPVHSHSLAHTHIDRQKSFCRTSCIVCSGQQEEKWNEMKFAKRTQISNTKEQQHFLSLRQHTRAVQPPTPPSDSLRPLKDSSPIDASQTYAAVVIVYAYLPPPPLRHSTLHNEATWGPRHTPGSAGSRGSQGNKLLPRSHASAPRTFSLSN